MEEITTSISNNVLDMYYNTYGNNTNIDIIKLAKMFGFKVYEDKNMSHLALATLEVTKNKKRIAINSNYTPEAKKYYIALVRGVIKENEATINMLEKEITDYLVLLSSHELPEEDSKILSSTFHVINDIERIGDHAKNIIELAVEKRKNKVDIEGEAREELINMYNRTIEAVNLAIDCYSNKDNEEAKKIKEIEDDIDRYEKTLRNNNIKRLNKKICCASASTIFLDIISNLERIGDHSTNIVESIV